MINIDDLVRSLDQTFSVQDLQSDPAMGRLVPKTYARIKYDYTEVFERDFCNRFNGLMLRSSEGITKVYCVSFPSPYIIQNVLRDSKGDALIFTHHPLDMEVAGAGFLAIPPEKLLELQKSGISVYSCHAPLDYHPRIGTNAAIVEAFGGEVTNYFAQYEKGFAGRVVNVAPTTVNNLLIESKKIFDVDRVEYNEGEFESVNRIAIVAGGGDNPNFFAEAEHYGAQVYLTGEWYTRIRPTAPEDKAWAITNRNLCKEYAEKSPIHFFGVSHNASEFLVMKIQMVDWFNRLGLHAVAVQDLDWWR